MTAVTIKPRPARSANWFRDRRKQLGLPREAIAAKLGVTVATVSNWERSQSYPLPTKAADLCKAYRVELPKLALQLVLLAIAVEDQRSAA